MGVLKDKLFLEIWRYLRPLPRCRVQLAAICHPVTGQLSVLQAWTEVLANTRAEGLKESIGLKQVLAERNDLFTFPVNENGQQLVGLTMVAQIHVSPDAGLPPNLFRAAIDSGIPPDEVQAAEAALAAEHEAEAQIFASSRGGGTPQPSAPASAEPATTASGEPPVKKTRTGQVITALLPPKDYWKPIYGKGGYQDIVWTPEIAKMRQAELRAEADMARALFDALDSFPRCTARICQLGQNLQVAKLKKEPPFKAEKLLDILERHSNVFDCLPDGTVKLHRGAEANLPDYGLSGEVRDADLILPPRMTDARSIREKLQAVRIELIHALHQRGGGAHLQELGQEPRVQKNRHGCPQAAKLSDLIRMFPANFSLNISEDGTQLVKLVGYGVNDYQNVEPPPVHRGGFSSSHYGRRL